MEERWVAVTGFSCHASNHTKNKCFPSSHFSPSVSELNFLKRDSDVYVCLRKNRLKEGSVRVLWYKEVCWMCPFYGGGGIGLSEVGVEGGKAPQ